MKIKNIKQSTRPCRNCEKNNPHTISCHVIPEKIERLRTGVAQDNGGQQRLSIDGNGGLEETRVSRGKFWCDTCEVSIGGIDNQFVPLIKKITSQIKNNSQTQITHQDKKILIEGCKVSILRHLLFKKMEIPADFLILTNDIYIQAFLNSIPPNSILLRTVCQINPQNSLYWDYPKNIGTIYIHFDRTYFIKMSIFFNVNKYYSFFNRK